MKNVRVIRSQISTFGLYAGKVQIWSNSVSNFKGSAHDQISISIIFVILESAIVVRLKGVPAVGGLKFLMAEKKLQKVPVWGNCHLGEVLVGGQKTGTSPKWHFPQLALVSGLNPPTTGTLTERSFFQFFSKFKFLKNVPNNRIHSKYHLSIFFPLGL